MRANQTSYGSNGLQNALFPLEIMWLTQGCWEHTYSHDHQYAMDFQGATLNSSDQVVREYNCPVYAPFDCICVAHYGSNAPAIVWTSSNPVNFVDGTTGYCTIQFTHENDSIQRHPIGQEIRQGEIISHTGTMGTSGDHIHIEAKKGTYQGFTPVGNSGTSGLPGYRLTNSSPLYDLLGVNDTVLYKDYYVNQINVRVDYSWTQFSPSPSYVGDSNFKWVLYARKLRNKRVYHKKR